MEFQPFKLFLFLSFPLTLSHFSSFEDPDMKKKIMIKTFQEKW
jgi:hypothetical protein